MDLVFWWMLLFWVAAGAGYWILLWQLNKGKRKHSTLALPAAHTHRLTAMPAYIAALKEYRLLVRCSFALLSLGLLAAILLSARPATVSLVTPVEQNRDIMLCLDASGSVLREDTALLDQFTNLVNNFSGQRFGLTLFNSSAVNIIPLNDNYQLTTSQLKVVAQAFKVQKGQEFTELTNGTLVGFQNGTSLASDGLASCVEHMDNNVHRSENIILATDNESFGTPLVSMSLAASLAKQYNVHIYAIDPGISDQKLVSDHTQLQNVTEETGGAYYKLSNPDAVNDIIGNIKSQNSENYIGISQLATNDDPSPFIYVAILATIVGLAIIWRLEL